MTSVTITMKKVIITEIANFQIKEKRLVTILQDNTKTKYYCTAMSESTKL